MDGSEVKSLEFLCEMIANRVFSGIKRQDGDILETDVMRALLNQNTKRVQYFCPR